MPSRPSLPALTGLRGLAALAVAFSHMPHLYLHDGYGPTTRRLIAEGFVGVPFFFILSGFVLAYTCADRFERFAAGGLRDYFAARIGRIGPVHWVTLLAAAAYPALGNGSGDGASSFAANALLVHGWSPNPNLFMTYNTVSWTLCAEAFFYLCLPALLWSLRRAKLGPVPLVAAGVSVLGVEAAVVAAGATDLGQRTFWLIAICPAVRFGEFALGVTLGLAFATAPTAAATHGLKSQLLGTILEVAAAFLLTRLLVWSDRVPMAFRLGTYYAPVMAAVIVLAARQRGWLSGLAASRPAVWAGEISFAFYMAHCLVFVAMQRMASLDALGVEGRAAVHLAAALAAAVGLHYGVERPLRPEVSRFFAGGFRVGLPFSPVRTVPTTAPPRNISG